MAQGAILGWTGHTDPGVAIASSLVDDEYHALLFVLVLLAFTKISLQQCSLGSPELSLKALMAYPKVKIVASFIHRC
jgi:hypothetical protein